MSLEFLFTIIIIYLSAITSFEIDFLWYNINYLEINYLFVNLKNRYQTKSKLETKFSVNIRIKVYVFCVIWD